MSRDSRPGDLAMVDGRWRWNEREECPAIRRPDGWVSVSDAAYILSGDAVSARPLLVIDPEDREQVERLRNLMDEAYYAQSEGALDFPALRTIDRGNALQAALRALIAEPETPPEPTDPAVRVVDRDGDEWARRSDGAWVCIGREGDNDVVGAVGDWPGFQGDNYRVVTPDSPAPDDRPLKVGDRVKVAADGGSLSGELGRITWQLNNAVEVIADRGDGCLTHDTRVTRLPDEEAAR